MKTWTLVLGALALVSLLGANAVPPYDIHAILPLTGSGAFSGQVEQQTLETVARIENSKGGIRGRDIRFVFHDDQSNPATSIQMLTQAMSTQASVVIGGSLVSTCSAMQPLVKTGPVQYCLSPGLHPTFDSYSFVSSLSTVDLNRELTQYLYARGARRFAIIAGTDATGQESVKAFRVTFNMPELAGAQLVDVEQFNPTDVTVVGQIEHLRTFKPDVLFVPTTGPAFATVLRALRDTGLEVIVGGGIGNMYYEQMRQYESFLPKEMYFCGPGYFRDPKDISEPWRSAVVAFNKAFAPVRPGLGQGLAYDAARIIIAALRQLGPDATATQIRDYIHQVHGYAGANGIYDFRSGENRGLGSENAAILRYDAAKHLFVVISKPGELR
jgi:branched-chain amino acid transport system substrate-binding protein